MNKLLILKSPSDHPLEINIVDSVYVIPGKVMLIPNGTEIDDPSTPYKELIKQLEYELAKAKRAKKHILSNVRTGA